MKYNKEAHERFRAARDEYLLANGWVAVTPTVPGAPQWWRNPYAGPNEQDELLDEYAALEQERRDNDQERAT